MPSDTSSSRSGLQIPAPIADHSQAKLPSHIHENHLAILK